MVSFLEIIAILCFYTHKLDAKKSGVCWLFFYRDNKILVVFSLSNRKRHALFFRIFFVQHSVSQAQGKKIPRALFAFKVSMIHIVLQFTQVIVVCYVRHRVKGPEASIVKSCKFYQLFCFFFNHQNMVNNMHMGMGCFN